MNFDVPVIIASIIFSAVGYIYISYGRRMTNLPVVAVGVALMGYGYFTPSLIACVGVGAILTALPFVMKWW